MEREKRDRQSTGREGEELAKNYLIERGFRILHTNWRTGHKELDIVAVKAEKIHFENAFYRHDIGAKALAAREEK